MNFLQAPVLRDAEIFTRMPARYRRSGMHSVWADANRGGAQVDSLLEGVPDQRGLWRG
jgi:gluconolactonase